MNPRNPYPTVDVIVETERGIVLIERRNPPHGWALPGGFIDYGERAEDAARREVREETGLEVELTDLLGVYSDPSRDPRKHTLSIVYVGRASGTPVGGDDAALAAVYSPERLPSPLCFDHATIVHDYRRFRHCGRPPRPAPPRGLVLDARTRAQLLQIAADALQAGVTGRPEQPVAGEDEGALAQRAGCFVTLYTADGALRGCIGSLEARQPLAAEVRAMTAAAAKRDYRFSPVQAAEVGTLRISLSVLSPLERLHDPGELRIGEHGVCIRRGPQRGVLLPQVAVEHGWDAETFLAQACHKGGLPPDAWHHPETEIYVFTATVFGQDDGDGADPR